ncbi:MAG: hypothetical protein GY797_17255 [Deltaproteobacteria bacterium]|nr:hypothetical protein [Deltaproteobacteria bacterium]
MFGEVIFSIISVKGHDIQEPVDKTSKEFSGFIELIQSLLDTKPKIPFRLIYSVLVFMCMFWGRL